MRYKTALRMVKLFKQFNKDMPLPYLLELQAAVSTLDKDTPNGAPATAGIMHMNTSAVKPAFTWTGGYGDEPSYLSRSSTERALQRNLSTAAEDAVREIMVEGMVLKGLGQPQDAVNTMGKIRALAHLLYDSAATTECEMVDGLVHALLKVPAREGYDEFKVVGPSLGDAAEKLYQKFMTGIAWLNAKACGDTWGYDEPATPITGPVLD